MRIKITEIKAYLSQAAAKHVSEDEAAYFADCYLETHLRSAPRSMPLQDAVDDLKVWQNRKDQKVKRVVDKGGVTVLDFDGLAPSLMIKELHHEIENKARQNGISALGLRNSAGIITLNLWSYPLAKRDLIGICMFNGGTRCAVPFGGRQGILGTNPMAYAIPTAKEPMALDMATTEIPFFELQNAKDKNIPLKPNVAVDQNGAPTTDASQALTDSGWANLLPIGGGFKGYGLMMLTEILSGSLVGSPLSTQQTPGWSPPEYGFFMLAMDIGSFTDAETFKQEVSQMSDEVRALQPADGFDAVPIPGDRGHAKQQQAENAGEIEIDQALLENLRQLAQ